MNDIKERLVNGLIKENPTFVLMLGMCPTLAVTTSAMNGLGMGLTTMVVLALSNAFISLIRNASKNPVIPSLFDGIGMGLGFSFALTCIGAVRELIGAGTLFGLHIMPESYIPCTIFIMAPGAFFVLAMLTAIQNKIKLIGEKKGKDMSKIQSGCGNDCLNCSDSGCTKRFYDEKAQEPKTRRIKGEEEKEHA